MVILSERASFYFPRNHNDTRTHSLYKFRTAPRHRIFFCAGDMGDMLYGSAAGIEM